MARHRHIPILTNDELNDSTKLTDEMVLSDVDFRYPGLAEAGKAFRRGDIESAKAEVLQHFRTRKRPVWPRYMVHSAWLTSSGRGPVLERANLLLEGKTKICWWPFPVIPFRTEEEIGRRLGRQMFVPELLTAYDETGDERYLVKLMKLFRTAWRLRPFKLYPDYDNRFPHWAPGHDLMSDGYVLCRWFDLVQHPVFRGESALTDDFRWEMLRQTWFQAVQYLRLEGARYRDDNHHLYEYGTAPFNTGYNLPEFRDFARMKRFGLAVVRKHLARTVFSDGTHIEHSVPYQQYILTKFAMVYVQGKVNGEELFTREQRERLRKWCEFQLWATKPDGWLCEMGDHVPPDLHYFLADHAALFPSGFVKSAAAKLGYTRVRPARHLEAAWKRIKPTPTKETSKVFPHGGYVVMRDRWSKDGRYMLVSARSRRNLPHAHIHWDPMHFVLCAFGRTLIGDPASRFYGRRTGHTLAKRGYHYSMGAHNVLIQNDDELIPHEALGNLCSWGGDPPVVALNRTALGLELDFVDMHHDGYAVRRWCVGPCEHDHSKTNRHRRIVLFLKDTGWIFIDEIQVCPNDIRKHDYDQLLHFEPDTDVKADVRHATIRTMNPDANVLVAAFGSPEAVVSVEPDPYMVAEDFPLGERPPVVGHLRRKAFGSTHFATLLLPYRGRRAPKVELEQADLPNGVCLTLKRGEDTDTIWVRLCGKRQAKLPDGTETDARVCVIRRRRTKPRRALIIDGTRLLIDGKTCPAAKMERLTSSKPTGA